MLKKLLISLVFIVMNSTTAFAAEEILFIPHDDRPVSYQQPVEVVSQLGYKIISHQSF